MLIMKVYEPILNPGHVNIRFQTGFIHKIKLCDDQQIADIAVTLCACISSLKLVNNKKGLRK